MRLLRLWPLVLLACGGTTGPGLDASVNDAGDAATSDAGAACVMSTLGAACTPGDRSCDRVDPCCAQTLVCDPTTRTWRDSGIACITCNGFACGPRTCMGGEVCVAASAGIPPPDGGPTVTYSCVPMPAACERSWSCACVSKNLPAACASLTMCTEEGVHPTLSCQGI